MIEELVSRAADGDEDAVEELSTIADGEPQRLTPYLGVLFDRDVWWPAKLYRAADADLVRRVVERVDEGQPPHRLNNLLAVLAHSGHPLAESALRRWSTQPPAGAERLHVDPARYAHEGGWALDPDGSRRDLCGDTAYQWVMREGPRRATDTTCPWCGSASWAVADLDTADPATGTALAHTGWSGRLLIETCHFCACYTTLYSQVTPTGTAVWWAGNTRPDWLPAAAGPDEPPSVLPTVGAALTSPYQASAWDRGGSTLGGRPDWIQDAEHPDCPGCGQPMAYVGLVGGADLAEYGEGAYYLHLHQPCGYAAVTYQQS
ncbi:MULTISPECIES: hypothetical protein [Micromonospora]|uniref:DUF1963 domain-containing protein n=1 Tax=Micromonospora yangpuensis TaxID=683228 RepID=A0A1C6V2P9_9ACTN|nr:hypothetical protein [Micromonospora yangpuensis]GGM14582.1 hypothetical protein GCM10012279_35840 [Micromonospora yangpuensis]SCL60613.1 hypothetical protein GA0070617_4429 [Micromonospora yangpuensis]